MLESIGRTFCYLERSGGFRPEIPGDPFFSQSAENWRVKKNTSHQSTTREGQDPFLLLDLFDHPLHVADA